MKILPFKIPKSSEETFMVQIDYEPYLYDMLHKHPEVQLTLVVEGTGSLFLGDYVGDFKPGDVFIVGSNIPHVFKSDKEHYDDLGLIAHCISVFFDENAFGGTPGRLPETKEIYDLILKSKQGIKVTGQTAEEIGSTILAIPELEGIDRVIQLLQLFATLVNSEEYQLLSLEVHDYDVKDTEGNRLNKVLQFTLNEYNRHITIEEVANIAHLTPSAFCRFFKQRTRKTYLNFLMELRISQACKLLFNKNHTITQICYMTGFNNVSNFNRKFKKLKGCSPSEYLKVHGGV
ncbi:AraC family transcriptional regulator [Flammeovirgaceae bacterium SG7u.111]|nr:AraC family transcriptional regulator [Flammeovirgaceae bacterium SG7u.132]WPO35135.1 AraC family transcriptional regulator [Flammeovirgaceae bacterium SG7u.111]